MRPQRSLLSGLKDAAVLGVAILYIGYIAIQLFESFTGPSCFIYWGSHRGAKIWKLWSENPFLCASASTLHVVLIALCVFALYRWATKAKE